MYSDTSISDLLDIRHKTYGELLVRWHTHLTHPPIIMDMDHGM